MSNVSVKTSQVYVQMAKLPGCQAHATRQMNYDCGYGCIEGCDVVRVEKALPDQRHSDLQSPAAVQHTTHHSLPSSHADFHTTK